MNRKYAIEILESMLSENNLLFSKREAIKKAIDDMKLVERAEKMMIKVLNENDTETIFPEQEIQKLRNALKEVVQMALDGKVRWDCRHYIAILEECGFEYDETTGEIRDKFK